MACKACREIFRGHAPWGGRGHAIFCRFDQLKHKFFRCLFNNDTKDLGLRHYKSVLIIIQWFVAGSWLARLHVLCR